MRKINTAKDDNDYGYGAVDLNYPRFAMRKGLYEKISTYLQALA